MLPTLLLAAYGCGILLASRFSAAAWPLLTLPLLIPLGWPLLRHRPTSRLLPAGLFLSLGLGLTYLAMHGLPGCLRVSELTGADPIRLTGTVVQLSRRTDGSLQLDLDNLNTLLPAGEHACAGRLRLTIAAATGNWQAGDRLQLTTRLRLPAGYGLPGEFNRRRLLAAQGVLATAYLPSDRGLIRLATLRPPELIARLQGLRQQAAATLTASLPERRAAILKTLLLGERGALDASDRQLLSRAGLAHLFSISGLHLGLLSALCYLVLEFFYTRSRQLLAWQPPGRVLPLLTLPPLWGYVQFTGAGYPVQRAFLMLAGGVLLYLWQRHTRPLNLLQGALLLVLLLQPLALFSPALQLSAAGIGGILILVPRWQGHLQPLPPWLRTPAVALLVTLAGTLTTLPLVWHHFNILSTAGPLLNLLAIPVIGLFALPAGLAGLLLAPLLPTCAGFLFQTAGAAAELILDLAQQLLSWPGFGGMESFPDPLQLTGAWLLVGVVLWFDPGTPGHWRRALPALATGVLLLVIPYPQPTETRVMALSVGQGESLLLSFSGRHYLLDGGGHYRRDFDVGARLVAPALGWLGVHRLDGIILSHDHPDHRGGLPYLLEHLPVAAFYSAIPAEELDPELVSVLAGHPSIRQVRLAEGWSTIVADNGWQLQAWAPPQQAVDANDRSLVTLLHNGEAGALLTGDLAAAGLGLLAQTSLPGPVNLFKLPHHGSRHADPTRLLERWRPPLAFVSAGRDNRFGFPHPEVCASCERTGTRLLRTDQDGTLTFFAESSGWRPQPSTDRLFR